MEESIISWIPLLILALVIYNDCHWKFVTNRRISNSLSIDPEMMSCSSARITVSLSKNRLQLKSHEMLLAYTVHKS